MKMENREQFLADVEDPALRAFAELPHIEGFIACPCSAEHDDSGIVKFLCESNGYLVALINAFSAGMKKAGAWYDTGNIAHVCRLEWEPEDTEIVAEIFKSFAARTDLDEFFKRNRDHEHMMRQAYLLRTI